MPTTAPTTAPLTGALGALREAAAACRFDLDVPGAGPARAARAELVHQLDDYVLPRLSRLDAPLLTVIGGSTGAGKSTIVNSLVRAPVSASGVLRPTTRSPVLVCHPDDVAWFADSRVLPELTRTSGSGTDHRTLQLVTSPALDPGLAFLDAPDIDSVVAANRRLAGQLLAAADLWLFVTTAARYADAVPWDVLQGAQERGTALAVLLDRVPPGAGDDVAAHLHEMLQAHGLGGAPLFVVPETALHDGLLPEPVVAPLRRWFTDLARDAGRRAAVVRRALDGDLPRMHRDCDRTLGGIGTDRRTPSVERHLRQAVGAGPRDAAQDDRARHVGHERGGRVCEQFGGDPLLHDPAGVEHGDPVAQQRRLLEVVGHEQSGRRAGRKHCSQLARRGRARTCVKRGQRLVEQQDAGPAGEGAGKRDALTLSSGERRRRRLGLRFEPEAAERLLGPGAPLGARAAAQPVGDVAPGAHVREERVVLEDVADLAAFGCDAPPDCGVEPDLIRVRDAPCIGSHQSRRDPKQRRLACSGGPDDRQAGAPRHVERHLEPQVALSQLSAEPERHPLPLQRRA